ncbi:type II toxin-antitoxin system RelE/ParE family toxin [Sphingomonas sp. TREG-RG-20F-R18-01]|uniref:type II toxin-antitoxin system RelE/ParE family toxin n=1 Tax=Sphingomonas sp. TREG-RG-20F-R18-01 TaxID=2914982 RepID=UPI001F5921DD
MRLLWETKARNELRAILDYIGDRNVSAAARMEDAIFGTVEMVLRNPFMYRPGRVRGTREAVAHPNYVIVYKADDDTVTILAVLHARQRYP